jgi:hypothetical protein
MSFRFDVSGKFCFLKFYYLWCTLSRIPSIRKRMNSPVPDTLATRREMDEEKSGACRRASRSATLKIHGIDGIVVVT